MGVRANDSSGKPVGDSARRDLARGRHMWSVPWSAQISAPIAGLAWRVRSVYVSALTDPRRVALRGVKG